MNMSFESFFEEVHGYAPFPWQSRLVSRVLEEGVWPKLLDLPTGAGKTSAIDVALYSLAAAPGRVPRRIVLVVDRRIIVDQGAKHAQKILAALQVGKAKEVAEQLRNCFSGNPKEDPFIVSVLRGGMPRQSAWARRPDQPVVVLSTVDQVGSRLLFRGYGVSSEMSSVHAGLLGQDTLYLLDEVHLSEPFRQTLTAVHERWISQQPDPAKVQVVQMSATASVKLPAEERFGLDIDDHNHTTLERRLTAAKPTALEVVKVSGRDESAKRRNLAEHAAQRVVDVVSEQAKTVGVVVNRVETARLICAQLRNLVNRSLLDCTILLLTGRMRSLDRDRCINPEGMYWPYMESGRERNSEQRPLVVVATQTIEAGADLDFDAVITECASVDALRQRFGRLDRRGDVSAGKLVGFPCAKGVVLVRSDQLKNSDDDPVYGSALSKTAIFLKGLGANLDFGISAFTVPADQLKDMLAHRPAAPILMPAHVYSWVQTSPKPYPEPDVALFLHGEELVTPEINIVWRSEVDLLTRGKEPEEEQIKILARALAACPPKAGEALHLPIHAARIWLSTGEEDDVVDVVGTRQLSSAVNADSSENIRIWDGDTIKLKTATQLLPGETVILPCSQGGLSDNNWDPQSKEPVTDIGDLAQLDERWIAQARKGLSDDNTLQAYRGRPTLRLWDEALQGLGASGSWLSVPLNLDEKHADDIAPDEIIHDWIVSHFPPNNRCLPEDEAHNALTSSRRIFECLTAQCIEQSPKVMLASGKLVTLGIPVKGITKVEVVGEGDAPCFLGKQITLEVHSKDVREWAEGFCKNLEISNDLAKDIKFAAFLHDVGKADPRFQQLLRGGSEIGVDPQGVLLAKSNLSTQDRTRQDHARQLSGYPVGERHELLSMHILEKHPEILSEANDASLVLHLVSSHHGYCRPFAPVSLQSEQSEGCSIEFQFDEYRFGPLTTQHQAARLDSGVSDRFWELVDRYGPWKLAWLEAIVRLADHRASEEEEEGRLS